MAKGDGPGRPPKFWDALNKYDLRLSNDQKDRVARIAALEGRPPRTWAREALMRAVEDAERRLAVGTDPAAAGNSAGATGRGVLPARDRQDETR